MNRLYDSMEHDFPKKTAEWKWNSFGSNCIWSFSLFVKQDCFTVHHNLTPMYTSKTYLFFGTDSAHVIDVTGSLIIENENIDQNVQLEWKIFFYQWTVWA